MAYAGARRGTYSEQPIIKGWAYQYTIGTPMQFLSLKLSEINGSKQFKHPWISTQNTLQQISVVM